MKRIVILFGLMVGAAAAIAQKPPMLDKYKEYKRSVLKAPSRQMIELKSLAPTIVYDLKYALADNFMQRRMYPAATAKTFLRKDAAFAIENVQKELSAAGLGLKIFDAYRPWDVSKKFWDLVHDERYVANPAHGSNHNRGTAVDLTIINLKTGKELNMGTGFDNFTDSAHHGFKNLPDEVLKNRELLRNVMEKNGFSIYNEEWWHYTFKSDTKFEVLNIPFKKFGRD